MLLSREGPHQPLYLWLQELSSEDLHTLLCRVAIRLLVLLPQCIVSYHECGRCCIFFACQALDGFCVLYRLTVPLRTVG